ncbi:MAG: DsbA family protein [Reyranellaceae bacterium]
MARTLEFYFDYGSPYSYLADTQVETIAKRTGAALVHKPRLLGGVFKSTGNQSPMMVDPKGKWANGDRPTRPSRAACSAHRRASSTT